MRKVYDKIYFLEWEAKFERDVKYMVECIFDALKFLANVIKLCKNFPKNATEKFSKKWAVKENRPLIIFISSVSFFLIYQEVNKITLINNINKEKHCDKSDLNQFPLEKRNSEQESSAEIHKPKNEEVVSIKIKHLFVFTSCFKDRNQFILAFTIFFILFTTNIVFRYLSVWKNDFIDRKQIPGIKFKKVGSKKIKKRVIFMILFLTTLIISEIYEIIVFGETSCCAKSVKIENTDTKFIHDMKRIDGHYSEKINDNDDKPFEARKENIGNEKSLSINIPEIILIFLFINIFFGGFGNTKSLEFHLKSYIKPKFNKLRNILNHENICKIRKRNIVRVYKKTCRKVYIIAVPKIMWCIYCFMMGVVCLILLSLFFLASLIFIGFYFYKFAKEILVKIKLLFEYLNEVI